MRKVVPKVIGDGIEDKCKNHDDRCSWWAVQGECQSNPKYMRLHCAPACNSCESLTVEGRCPLDPDAPHAWRPGDLDAMFQLLTSEPYKSEFSMEILSSPETTDGPWVITMENVVSADEAERLIALGGGEGYERSEDVGRKKADGTYDSIVSTGRTSTNAWCGEECSSDEKAQAVLRKLSNITGIPKENSEHLQLLRYEEGQFYRVHHDYISHHQKRQCGPRILTLYLYLNDVEAGGGTNFDKLNITVTPKRGRAVLWPSVMNDAPGLEDPRTTHQALPVEKGIKYGANAWFHMHDFKTPYATHCL